MSEYTKDIAILALVAIECFALSKGIDGVLLAGVVAAIAGLGGYNLRKYRENGVTSLESRAGNINRRERMVDP